MTPPALCVVLHDVADANLAACERLVRAVEDVATVPMTHLAVPCYHGSPATPTVEQWLTERSQRGDELSLHGWSHRDDGTPGGPVDRLRRRTYTRGEGEFWALDTGEASARLAAGRAWFERHGWPLTGFVAPAWLLGDGAWHALRRDRFDYASTLRHIHLLPGSRKITSQSLVYSTSSAWRRASSVVWARIVSASLTANPVARIELHPRDADHAGVRRSWQRLLEQQLRGRTPLTVAQLVTRWRQPGAGAAPDSSDASASA